MADQALAQTGALKDPFGAKPSANVRYTLRYKLAWRWQEACVWTRYLSTGRHRDVPSLVDFVLRSHYIRARQVPSELKALGRILEELAPVRALEIGTAEGGTLFFLTRLASPRATILSVDLPGGRFGGGYATRRGWFYRQFAHRGQRLQLFQGDSHSTEMVERVRTVLQREPLDYLFIDGDHTYAGVRRDFEMYAPLVRKGGIIALHDIAEHLPGTGCEVSRFWNELKPSFRHQEIIQDRMQGWAGLGILYVE